LFIWAFEAIAPLCEKGKTGKDEVLLDAYLFTIF